MRVNALPSVVSTHLGSCPRDRGGNPPSARTASSAASLLDLLCLPSGTRTDENGAHRRRPPLPSAVRRRDAFGGQRAGDLGEPSTARVLEADALDDARGKRRRSTSGASSLTSARRHKVVAQEPLELIHGNEPLAPGELDGVDRGDDAPVDGRDAHAERLCRLPSRVGESLDLAGLPKPMRRRGSGRSRFGGIAPILAWRPQRSPGDRFEFVRRARRPARQYAGTVVVDLAHVTRRLPASRWLALVDAPPLAFAAPLSSQRHRRLTVISASDSTLGASVSGLLSR
jgi:hypothetical protein